MQIKSLHEVAAQVVPGYAGIQKRIVIGKADGSDEIALRHFSVTQGGCSPHHTHDFPHLVRVESGEGCVSDSAGVCHALKAGDYVFVKSNELHQFKNTGTQPFEFICIVPDRGES
jgi:quercetin dioxygenase-like cupin family protein